MVTVATHLPRSFVDKGNYQNIMQLFSLLDLLEKLLFENNDITRKDLETIFTQQKMTGSESFLDASSLQCVRSKCLFILKSLQASLSNLGFPKVFGKSSTEEFCFQKASLIFCTISSAFKLHSVDMEPFQLLVIDEAAQVKECETTIAFQIKDVRHATLVGDEIQLPATASSKLSEEAGFGRSLFERLSSMGHPKHLLNVQYRMHPSIRNERTLCKSDSVWEEIVSDAKNRRCFFNADEDSDIGKTIIEVKKELDQLDDLLSGESTLFDNLRCQVLFSENFRKSFKNLRFSNTRKLFKVDTYHVVCSIDMMKDSIYKQVLKVWDILPMTDTTKLLKRIDSIASMYTEVFINHCNDKLFERNLEVPKSWPLSRDISCFKKATSSTKSVPGASTSSAECRTYVENSKLIAQYKETTYQRCNEQHAASAGRGSTSSINVATGTESVPPATERRSAAQAAAAAVRREPAAAYAGKELTNVVTRRQPPSYAEVVSNSGDRDKATRFPTREDPAAPEPVEKSSSYREESNFLSDLKYHEKKALNKLKTKLEANILKNSIFTKKEFPKKETAAAAVPEEKKPSEETCEKKEESENPKLTL
ncbi:hypothetical protein SASPL_129915 [Salvia splendens]|uniref:DNA2/NAM7 helicase helicase domain-containing protein n=1 Tax=Salvia splendens TaxID=180675 RepID=A0A8X8XDK9_SALSN|nr:hypothetical protein SASPL_129915 [Salvia splendens]